MATFCQKAAVDRLGATHEAGTAFGRMPPDHNLQRSFSVLAVLAIAAVLLGAIVWLGFRMIDLPGLQPLPSQTLERRGAGEDILPAIVEVAICDDERPCS